jgi:hypothetical protein
MPVERVGVFEAAKMRARYDSLLDTDAGPMLKEDEGFSMLPFAEEQAVRIESGRIVVYQRKRNASDIFWNRVSIHRYEGMDPATRLICRGAVVRGPKIALYDLLQEGETDHCQAEYEARYTRLRELVRGNEGGILALAVPMPAHTVPVPMHGFRIIRFDNKFTQVAGDRTEFYSPEPQFATCVAKAMRGGELSLLLRHKGAIHEAGRVSCGHVDLDGSTLVVELRNYSTQLRRYRVASIVVQLSSKPDYKQATVGAAHGVREALDGWL